MRPQVCKLLWRKLERKIFGEPAPIPFELLLQALSRNPVDPRQVGIEHGALATDSEN